MQLKSITSCFKAQHWKQHCNCYLQFPATKTADKKQKTTVQTLKNNSLFFFPLIAFLLWNNLHFIVCLVAREILYTHFKISLRIPFERTETLKEIMVEICLQLRAHSGQKKKEAMKDRRNCCSTNSQTPANTPRDNIFLLM